MDNKKVVTSPGSGSVPKVSGNMHSFHAVTQITHTHSHGPVHSHHHGHLPATPHHNQHNHHGHGY